MGRRLLKINVMLLVDILKGFDCGNPRYFRVIEGHIPKDVKVLSVQNRPYHENTVEIELESEQWTTAEPGTEVYPSLEVVASEDQVKRLAEAFRSTPPGRYNVAPKGST